MEVKLMAGVVVRMIDKKKGTVTSARPGMVM